MKKIPSPSILEIGCGPGQLAKYLVDEEFKIYTGFDFSKVAIQKAKLTVPQFIFFVKDAVLLKSYIDIEYNTVICLEVLEHIKYDLKVIENIKIGAYIIFSVPNFDSESHVRWFTSESQIRSRYFKKINISEITRIGNIYICFGIRSDFMPNVFQYILKTREKIRFNSFLKRIKHKLKNLFKIKTFY